MFLRCATRVLGDGFLSGFGRCRLDYNRAGLAWSRRKSRLRAALLVSRETGCRGWSGPDVELQGRKKAAGRSLHFRVCNAGEQAEGWTLRGGGGWENPVILHRGLGGYKWLI